MTAVNDDRPFSGDPDAVIDARGLRCPLPVIRLAAHARSAQGVEVVEVLATDPAARADVPAWCRLRGQEYLGAVDHDSRDGSAAHTAYRVRISLVGAPQRSAAEVPEGPPGAGRGTPAG